MKHSAYQGGREDTFIQLLWFVHDWLETLQRTAGSIRLMPSWEKYFGMAGRISKLCSCWEKKSEPGITLHLDSTWVQVQWPECRERNPYLWNLEKEVSRTNRVMLHQETPQYSNEKQARSQPLFLIPSFRKPGYLFSTWLTPVRHLIGGKSRIVPPGQSPSTSDQVYGLYHVCTVISLAI